MSLPPSAPEAAGGARELVVADTGPLISLGRLDLLALLGRLFGTVLVPQPVWDECFVRPDRSDAVRIRLARDQGWLAVRDARPVDAPLDLGECAAIGLAMELKAGLLTDDLAARRFAAGVHIRVMGTLGVLVLGKRRGCVDAVAPLIAQLRGGGQRFSEVAVNDALRLACESPN